MSKKFNNTKFSFKLVDTDGVIHTDPFGDCEQMYYKLE